MADEKDRVIEHNRETTITGGTETDALSEKELENVTGGTITKKIDKSTPL